MNLSAIECVPPASNEISFAVDLSTYFAKIAAYCIWQALVYNSVYHTQPQLNTNVTLM